MFFSFCTFFPCFSPYSRFLPCKFLIFLICQFSRHIPGPTVCISHFPRFWLFLASFTSYSLCFTFSTFFSVSGHIPGPTLCISHFFSFSSFIAILQVLQSGFLVFHVFECSSPYSRSNSVCVSFFTFLSFLAIYLQCAFQIFTLFSVSRHISRPTVCVSHFP